MIPLSILDLSPVSAGSTAAQALRNSLDLARLADDLGFARYWVAEHHNLPAIASSAPDIMIGQIAAVTKRMRIGSGGVMLPNHAPLVIAERFKLLEALFPGRIDLGLGRAPGTDPATAYALRQRIQGREGDEFLELVLFRRCGHRPCFHAGVGGTSAQQGEEILFEDQAEHQQDHQSTQAHAAARLTGLAILGSLERELGDLDRIVSWTRVFGMVNSAPGFNRQPAVINGFTDLIVEVFGKEKGAHARSAVGMAELPFDIPVEIEGEVEITNRD